jgi:hypothetical protein
MARKTSLRLAVSRSITVERAQRLCRLIRLLRSGPQTRGTLTRKLRVDVRGFYRDLELLREAGINIPFHDQRYLLGENIHDVLERLPFPDPHLTLREAKDLAKGRTPAHRKVRSLIKQVEG